LLPIVSDLFITTSETRGSGATVLPARIPSAAFDSRDLSIPRESRFGAGTPALSEASDIVPDLSSMRSCDWNIDPVPPGSGQPPPSSVGDTPAKRGVQPGALSAAALSRPGTSLRGSASK